MPAEEYKKLITHWLGIKMTSERLIPKLKEYTEAAANIKKMVHMAQEEIEKLKEELHQLEKGKKNHLP